MGGKSAAGGGSRGTRTIKWGRLSGSVGRVSGARVPNPRRVGQNALVSAVRHLLVVADRDAAEEAAETASERFGLSDDPRVVREALAGEDDAEDAQWLVVIEDETGELASRELEELAEEYGGWYESE